MPSPAAMDRIDWFASRMPRSYFPFPNLVSRLDFDRYVEDPHLKQNQSIIHVTVDSVVNDRRKNDDPQLELAQIPSLRLVNRCDKQRETKRDNLTNGRIFLWYVE